MKQDTSEKVEEVTLNDSLSLEDDNIGVKLYSFGVLSDVHIDGDGTDEAFAADDFRKALNFFNNNEVAFVGISGDLTTENGNNELSLFKNIVDENAQIPVYVCRGNHDCRYSLDDWNTYIRRELQYEITYNTDKFLFLSMNAEDFGDGCLSTAQLDWLEEKLETYKNQRVFLFFHVFSPNTCGNINNIYPWDGLDTTSSKIQRFIKLITKYKNLVYFSGHSHLDFRCQKYGANANVFDDGSTCHRVHVPSCSKPRKNDVGTGTDNTYDNNQGSQGYIVDVYENAIILRGYDFEIDKYLPISNYLIDTTIVEIPEEQTTFVTDELALYLNGANGITDLSGNNVALTAVGSPNVSDGEIILNGSSQCITTDYVPSDTTNLTVELYAKVKNKNTAGLGDDEGSVFSIGTATPNRMSLQVDDKLEGLSVWGNNEGLQNTGASITENELVHIVYKITNGTLDCFINGTKYANVITGWQAITGITSSTLFAKYSANSQYFYGAVKQLRIYDKALTDEEVQQNYEYCTNS